MTTADRIPLLVLGLGNVLCEDDGAGVAALHQLHREWDLPDGVLALDGGTLGLALLPLVERAEIVVLVDAIRGDGPPGTRLRIEGADVAPAVYERLSPHQIGVADLLGGAALLGRYPATVVLLGVVPASTDLGLGCTPDVAAAIPGLVDDVVAELAALGRPATRASVTTGPPRRVDDAALALGL
ncbi:MAG: hydrogenase maturation protease [Kofleriaceae bacterium]|nr:hydrogenase maturation protease [Myxococcales bacterium]MCB9563952.1 hydrogenase maturation protease [Kofleriaceae bacterium]